MKKSKVYALCEGAIMVALATALSYVKLMELPQGGSVCIGMLPLFIYFFRWDWKHSFLAAFAYGLLQLIFDGAYAWGPTSMLLDYVLAFTVLGVATFFRKMKGGLYIGATVACVCRFLVHFISGVTIYRCLQRQLCAHRPDSLPCNPCDSVQAHAQVSARRRYQSAARRITAFLQNPALAAGFLYNMGVKLCLF